MGKWTAPGVARALAAGVLGEGFVVRGGVCSFQGGLTSRVLVKAVRGALVEPGRGCVRFPAVEIFVDVSVDYPDRAVEKFGQFGFWVPLRSALRVDAKGRPEGAQYRIGDVRDGLPGEIVEDVGEARGLLALSPRELVELMSDPNGAVRFGRMNLGVYVRNRESRLVKAYLMARRLGLRDCAERIVQEYCDLRERKHLAAERQEVLDDYRRSGFDVSELRSALGVGSRGCTLTSSGRRI
ncbi:hypothetical protein [Kitasatospora sp. NPDC008115]|uniref:hypothetical protein n=1 Tax=Kitasatospora sp. NPDC008115 TaxID=3364022 RepID=UPI0036E190D7